MASVRGSDAASPRVSTGAGGCPGPRLPQAVSTPRIAAPNTPTPARTMWLLILEALAAGGLLVFIVWWTMFSGRDKGERQRDDGP